MAHQQSDEAPAILPGLRALYRRCRLATTPSTELHPGSRTLPSATLIGVKKLFSTPVEMAD